MYFEYSIYHMFVKSNLCCSIYFEVSMELVKCWKLYFCYENIEKLYSQEILTLLIFIIYYYCLLLLFDNKLFTVEQWGTVA